VIHQNLQVRPLGADVRDFEQHVRRQLLLDVEVPLVRHRGVQTRVVAGNAGKFGLIQVEGRETSGDRQNRSDAIADKTRLEEEGEVVSKLQGVAGADLLVAEEPAVAAADYGLAALEGTPGQAQARRKIVFIGGDRSVGSPVLSRDDDLAGGKVKCRRRSP